MRVLVAGDSHGRDSAIYDMLKAHPEATHLLFLGDGIRDLEQWEDYFPEIQVIAVRGNNDWGAVHVPTMRDILIGGKRILMVHGHEHGVKYGMEKLLNIAGIVQADILLYGHTHAAETTYCEGLYIVNPGSLGHGRTYAILDIAENGVLPSIVSL